MSESLLISPGQQPGSCRAAKRMRHIPTGATDALSRQPVEVRRWNVLAAVETHISVTQIISDDHQHIRLLIRPHRTAAYTDQSQQCEERFHAKDLSRKER